MDEGQVLIAIRAAETQSSGQIRVFVSHRKTDDALGSAAKQFARLGMTKTQARNGVLIFLAPRSRAFAIFGDVAIDQKCGTEFWGAVRDEILVKLKAEEYTAALVHAVNRTGEKLKEHFPATGVQTNELPDAIARD